MKKYFVLFVLLLIVMMAVSGLSAAGIVTAQKAAAQPTNVQSYTGSFVGSKNSKVYHYPSCSEAKKIKAENLVTFATVADACAANYRPCKVCNPPPCSSTPTPTPTPKPTSTPTPTPKPTSTPTPTPKPTSTPTPSLAGTSPVTANVPQASAAASNSSPIPGFGGLYALGALAAMFLALRVTRRS